MQALQRAENKNKKQHYEMIVSSEDDDAMGAGEELANAVWLMYNMPNENYAQMCKNALQLVRGFDYKKLTDKLIDIIEDV